MLKFAFKNMAIKKVQIILIVLSIVISAGIGVLAFNVATQVDKGSGGKTGRLLSEYAGYVFGEWAQDGRFLLHFNRCVSLSE